MLASSPTNKALYLRESWLHVWQFCRACVNGYFLLIWTFCRCWYERQDIIWTCCYLFKLRLKSLRKWYNVKKWFPDQISENVWFFQHLPIFYFQKIVLTQLYHWNSLYEERSSDLKNKLALSLLPVFFQ